MPALKRFVDIPRHAALVRDLLYDFKEAAPSLLIGNQGVGKNVVADRLLQLLRCEREYVQLHRDTTLSSLTAAPALRDGRLVWEDSPLVKAAKYGRCLVIDEADKAPLEVVCVLKALLEDGDLALADGRRVVLNGKGPGASGPGVIKAHPGFRVVVLANRPGWPFLGNDFYRECGDVLSAHVVENPDKDSELALLTALAPNADAAALSKLVDAFGELRELADAGALAYPYSTRELCRVARHLDAFPNDAVADALEDVLAHANPRRPRVSRPRAYAKGTDARGASDRGVRPKFERWRKASTDRSAHISPQVRRARRQDPRGVKSRAPAPRPRRRRAAAGRRARNRACS